MPTAKVAYWCPNGCGKKVLNRHKYNPPEWGCWKCGESFSKKELEVLNLRVGDMKRKA